MGAHPRQLTLLAVALAGAAVFLGFGVAGAGAPPPSVPVQGEVDVTHSCVVFGGKIGFEGLGYAPETPVHVYVSTSRYTLPGALAPTTVRSNRAGEIKGSLPAPEGSGGKWEWLQQAIFASGLDRGGKHLGQSFDLVVIGTPRVCRALGNSEE